MDGPHVENRLKSLRSLLRDMPPNAVALQAAAPAILAKIYGPRGWGATGLRPESPLPSGEPNGTIPHSPIPTEESRRSPLRDTTMGHDIHQARFFAPFGQWLLNGTPRMASPTRPGAAKARESEISSARRWLSDADDFFARGLNWLESDPDMAPVADNFPEFADAWSVSRPRDAGYTYDGPNNIGPSHSSICRPGRVLWWVDLRGAVRGAWVFGVNNVRRAPAIPRGASTQFPFARSTFTESL